MKSTVPLTVACDESGNDGENLLAGSSPVFAHASVAMTEDEAAELMTEVRSRTGSQSMELKSKTIIHPKHEATARWLLQHPLLADSASVHLTHKRYFIVAKLFDATAEEAANDARIDMYADGSALCGANILYFFGPSAFAEKWDNLLETFQQFLRSKTAGDAHANLATLNAAFAAVLSVDTPMHDFIEMAHAGISHLGFLSELQLGQGIDHRLRTLDPLISAVGAAVAFWAEKTGRPVEIVHDAASEMTPQRTAAIRDYLARPDIVSPSQAGRGVELRDLILVDSKHDERVQVADLVAGLARVVGEDSILGKEHPLSENLYPFVSDYSLWPSERLMNPEEAKAVVTRARR
ncbi:MULTISPECIES: DUF3800 domain-containing protein [unclassified Microbacterium]|uniref:DUF3800 domain-containing protein n=1 Tax=unclassified Microbacterium TaxID=2609290 RepID=UPI00300FFF20